MAAGTPLGRLLNLTFTADDVYVSLKEAGAVTFVGQLAAGDTFTVTSASDAAGTGAAALAKVTKYYRAAAAGGVWTEVTQAAGSTFTTSDTKVAVATIRGEQLPDGHDYVKCASTSTGTVMAITHDLKHQATPAGLASVIA